ncbi:MAG: adenosylcobinamide-GDP ribazoletransferase [Deltaproteobacteria bacterium]|nr:adenosylcobinamide-GDP ribazoletransferase [Deltaproteobacteria bacterium]
MSGIVSAIRTLTVFRIPGKDAPSLATAMPWFPLVGAILGSMLYGVYLLFSIIFPDWIFLTAMVVLLAQTGFTGAIHLDGLADSADALFSMKDKARKLEILKDSRLGTFGVLALIGSLMLKWLLLCKLMESGEMQLIIVAMILSRTVQVDLAATLSYARADSGTAKRFVTDASSKHRLIAWLAALFFVAGFGPLCAAAIVVAFITGKYLSLWFKRQLGGVTGDLLGASSEIVEMAMLFLFSAWLHHFGWLHWPWALWLRSI